MSQSKTSKQQISSQYLRVDSKKSIFSSNQTKNDNNLIEALGKLDYILLNKKSQVSGENDDISIGGLDLNLIMSQLMSNKKSEKDDEEIEIDLNSSEFKNIILSQLESTTPKEKNESFVNLPQLSMNLSLLTNKKLNITTAKKNASQCSGEKIFDNICDEDWEKLLNDQLNDMNVIPESKEENNQTNSLISAESNKSLVIDESRIIINTRQNFELQKVEEIAVISEKRNEQVISNTGMNYLAPITIIIDEFQNFLTNLKAKLNASNTSILQESVNQLHQKCNVNSVNQVNHVTIAKPQVQPQSIMKNIKPPSNSNDDDSEFNNFLKNIKNSSNKKNFISENPFLKASSNKIEKTSIGSTINKTVNDDEFDNLMQTFKNKKNVVTLNNSFNNINNSSNKEIKDKEEVDVEFDAFLQNINNKKAKKAFNPPQMKKDNLIKSDFMSGTSKVNFKPNEKIKNLLSEMEKDHEDEFDIKVKEETKKYKEYKVKENITKNNISNITSSNLNSINDNKSSTKKIRINDFSTDKLNIKRNHNEHVKSLNPETQKSVNKIMENNKKPKFLQSQKLSDNMKKVKFNPPQILKTNQNLNNLKKDFFLNNISTCGYPCICIENNIIKCTICNGNLIVTITNFANLFKHNYSERQTKQLKLEFTKDHAEFFNYQYKLASWKYYILSKHFDDPTLFSLKNVLNNISEKFKIVFEEGKRSFLTKVAEKDSSINRNMILLLLDIQTFTTEANETQYILEMTDGYKSVFSEISSKNPISILLKKETIIPGVKLNIGLAKVDRVTDDFKVFISIYYNSLSKAEASAKLGPYLKNRFLIKNLANLREDGGDISLIDVVILKKYSYHVFDFTKKEKISASKFEKLIENFNEGLKSENQMNNRFPYENVHYVFKVVCADSLLQLDNLFKIMPDQLPNHKLLNKKFAEKLHRKCVIEFTVKSKEIFDNILNCKRYQIGLLNLTKKNSINYLKGFNDPKNLLLKANDSVLIREIPPIEKTSNMFPHTVYTIKQHLNFPQHEVDISEIYDTDQFDKLKHEDLSCGGLYLGQSYSSNPNEKSLFIFMANCKQNLVLIKIHDEKFYDFSNLSKAKSMDNSIYIFRDLKFQILYYYNSNNLVAFNPSFRQNKNFSPKNIVIYLETQCYSTFHNQNYSSNVSHDIRRALVDIPDKKLYYDDLLEEIKKCI